MCFSVVSVRKCLRHSLSIERSLIQEGNQHSDWVAETRRRLAQSRGKKPETKAGQIRALWPEIKLAVAGGQRIGTICSLLREEAGIQVTPNALTSYIARCRKKEAYGQLKASATPTQLFDNRPRDPMAIAREALNKPRFDIRKVHNDGDPTGRKLI